MPMVELSDSDISLLELSKKVGGVTGIENALKAFTLHRQLYGDQKTGNDYRKLMKVHYPETQTLDDVAAPVLSPLEERIKKLEERNSELETKAAEDSKNKLQADFETSFNTTATEYELTEEGKDALLKFMKDRQLADPEAAAALYYKKNPKPPEPITPTSIAPANWGRDFGITHDKDDKEAEFLMRDPDAWAAEEAAAVLNETRRDAVVTRRAA